MVVCCDGLSVFRYIRFIFSNTQSVTVIVLGYASSFIRFFKWLERLSHNKISIRVCKEPFDPYLDHLGNSMILPPECGNFSYAHQGGFGFTSNDNLSQVSQVGDDNYSHVDQYGPLGTDGSMSMVAQLGDANQALVWQDGDSHNSVITQTGDANLAYTQQNGDNSDSEVMQTGDANWSEVYQLGSGHMSIVTQTGDMNSSYVSQTGMTHMSTVTQLGNSNVSSVVQIN